MSITRLGLLFSWAWIFVVCAIAVSPSSLTDQPENSISIRVDGGSFHVTRGGHLLRPDELVGAKLIVKDEKGVRQAIRIDHVVPDPVDPMNELYLYDIHALNAATGDWLPLCQPGPDGLALAFPLQGSWTSDGRHINNASFTMTCTAGAIGKCVRFGYKPWRTAISGQSMWDYHQACVRMVRADYCGDGSSWTRDGTLINFYDRLNVQTPDHSDSLQFEAAWTPNGAVCVQHPRIPALSDFKQSCGAKLQPESCSRETTEGAALLWNESAR